MAQWVKVQSCNELQTWSRSTWVHGVIRLSGLLALVPSDGFNGAERSVKPGLLSSLHLVEGQTQVVFQVLVEVEREL